MSCLEGEVLDAIRDVLAQGRVRQAADILPALAATNTESAWQAIELFEDDDAYRPGAEGGVAFTLGRIDSREALERLDQLSRSDQPGAAVAAEMALRLRHRRP